MHRFYNQDLSPDEVEDLDWANWLTLQSVQAFLGDISDNVLGVAVQPRPEAVTMHVSLRQRSDSDEEAIDDALADLDVLLDGHIAIDCSIVYERPDVSAWQAAGLRFVFSRRL